MSGELVFAKKRYDLLVERTEEEKQKALAALQAKFDRVSVKRKQAFDKLQAVARASHGRVKELTQEKQQLELLVLKVQ